MRIILGTWTLFILALVGLGIFKFETYSVKANQVTYYLDPSGDATVETIQQKVFRPVEYEVIPPEARIVWVRIPVPEEVKKWNGATVLFSGSTEMSRSMRAYRVDGTTVKNIGYCDVSLSSPECELPNLQFAFPLREAGSAAASIIYLRVNGGNAPVQNQFYFMARPYYNKITAFLTYFVGFSTGVSLLVSVLTLMIFASGGSKHALLFAAYTFFSFAMAFVYRGMWDDIRPGEGWLHGADIYLLIFFCARCSELVFVKSFFATAKSYTFINRIFLLEISALIFLAAFGELRGFRSFAWTALEIFLFLSPLTILSALFYFAFKKHEDALPFLFAWGAEFSALLVWAAQHFHILSNLWVLGYMPLIFRPLQLILMSFVVFNKIRDIIAELATAQVKERESHVIKMLLRTLAHDLSNTTQLIRLSSEMALKSTDQKVINRNLERISSSTRAQIEIIKNAKDAYLNNGGVSLKLKPVDLIQCLDEILDLLQFKFDEKKIRVLRNYEKKECLILSDRTTLEHQVLANLLDNAVKFTPAGKNISLRVDLSDAAFVSLEIADEGLGMNEQEVQNIFSELKRVSQTGTAHETGTGSGLLVVRDFMKAYGAEIQLDSRLNQGSRFILKFKKPLRPEVKPLLCFA